jgi:hypothetical protein
LRDIVNKWPSQGNLDKQFQKRIDESGMVEKGKTFNINIQHSMLIFSKVKGKIKMKG